MLLSLLLFAFCEEQCTPLTNGIVLSKYYLNTCGACKRLEPVIQEIMDRANKEQIPIKLREVECAGCECEGITNFPTLELTQDKLLIDKKIGFHDFDYLKNWLSTTLSLDKDAFGSHIEHEDGFVKQLLARDFLTGFDGQWMILFYENEKDMRRELFKELAKMFSGKISLAEVNKAESESITLRYNISEYPLIMGINHNTPVPYAGKIDLAGLTQFAEKLHTAAFQEITYQELKNKTKGYVRGEPVYVVLYKNYEIASYYFNDLAQQFKFKATIYRSSDPAMFEAAGYHPKELNEFSEAPDHNKMVYLSVYKNSTFFVSPEKLDNKHENVTWIFHTHFPHVTEIDNENFYSVFHGIKPIVLLLTKSDFLVESFNRLSANWNLGTASSNLIFAILDTIEYPLFKQQILGQVKEPAIVFYDPVNHRWFYRQAKMTNENFNRIAMSMIDAYFNRKLESYPKQARSFSAYIIVGLVMMLAGVTYKAYANRRKVVD